MKQGIILFSACCILFFATSAVFAHPPQDIKITFDSANKVLTAVIVHNTSNPDNHYIAKVDIGLNGKEIIGQDISKQDNNAEQTVSYRIPDVKDGDVVSVEGYCSISGKLEKEITVKTANPVNIPG